MNKPMKMYTDATLFVEVCTLNYNTVHKMGSKRLRSKLQIKVCML